MRRFHPRPPPPPPHLSWRSLGRLLGTLQMIRVVVVAQEQQPRDTAGCDLQCPTEIGATCAYGDSPHTVMGTSSTSSSSSTSNVNGMHCSCPLLYTGVRCEVPYESCGDGQHVCYHGGNCREGEVDDFGNVQLYCDCSSASSGYDPSAVFVGKYCQHATISEESTKCDSSNQDTFCFNQGVCNTQYPAFGDGPCLCSNGHTGPRCEYTKGDNSTVVEASDEFTNGNSMEGGACSLQCQNGGTCVAGQPDQTIDFRFWANPSTTEYCQCTDNWDGPYCDIPRVGCGDNLYCFYGSTCEQEEVDGQTLHYCDCRNAETDTDSYAGRFCQYAATEFCTKEPLPDGHLFCTNQGTCRSNAYEGCDCPDGYSGFSCEFRTEEVTDLVGDYEPEDGEGILIDTEEQASCDLRCQNGGTCRHGMSQGIDALTGGSPASALQYCVCPPDFAGTYCENTLELEYNGSAAGQGSASSSSSSCPKDHIRCSSGACVGNPLLCECDDVRTEANLATFFAGSNCEHPINDLCLIDDEGFSGEGGVTLGQIMPGAPLFFCLNGGVCKDKVDPASGQGHPGCNCQEGWLGPHCELQESAPLPNLPQTNPYEQYGAESGRSGSEKAFLTLSILAVPLCAAAAAYLYMRRKRKRNDAITSSLNWSRPQYKDRPGGDEEINIAPKRGSTYSEDGVYEDAVHSSTRDSMAAHLAAAKAAQQQYRLDTSVSSYANDVDDELDDRDVSDHEPQVDMGPPLDDDGHELHNVSIV